MICETKLDQLDSEYVSNFFNEAGFSIYLKNRHTFTNYRSGGVLIAVRSQLQNFVISRNTEYDNMTIIELPKLLTGFERNLLIVCVYIPPHGTRYSNITLFEKLSDVILSYSENDYYHLICGDLNAHTNEECEVFELNEDLYDALHIDEEIRELLDVKRTMLALDIPMKRSSVDTKVDNSGYGNALLEVCRDHSLIIFNGRLCQDRGIGKATTTEGSVIDYIIGSPFLASRAKKFLVNDFDPMYSDQHCIIEMSLYLMKHHEQNLTKPLVTESDDVAINTNITRFKWERAKAESFVQNINIQDANNLADNAANLTVQEISNDLNSILMCAAKATMSCKKPHVESKTPHKAVNNLSESCKIKRREYYNAKGDNNRLKTTESHTNLVAKSKAYKKELKKDNREKEQSFIKEIRKMKSNDPKEYWQLFKKPKACSAKIDIDSLETHFRQLSVENEDTNDRVGALIGNTDRNTDLDTSTLNADITEVEVNKCIENLKNGKASGIDGILNEFIKHSRQKLIRVYTRLFNKVLEQGVVPDSWTIGLIVPIYKNKGDQSDPNNYRGITLLSCVGKLFTAILNERLAKFCKNNAILSECQTGFRHGYSTMDHIFLLKSVIDIFRRNKRKLYCCFVDYQKAFDSVWREALWYKTELHGISGRFMSTVKSLYQNVKSCVFQNGQTSEFFTCSAGVRQGENLSPLLFSLFVNDLEKYMTDNQCNPLNFQFGQINHMLKLLLLMYADDTVILSDSRAGLQKGLLTLENYCDKWKLNLNSGKTKVCVFSGSKVKPGSITFNYKGDKLEVVEDFKYLGVVFNYNGNFKKNADALLTQGRKAMFSVISKCRKYNLPVDIQLQLFDSMVAPILLYGSEVWGEREFKEIEKLHIKFLKHTTRLYNSTCTQMVYGELGRFPLEISIKARMVGYWSRLIKGDDSRLGKIMYNCLLDLHRRNVYSPPWLIKIKSILDDCGLSEIWVHQNPDIVRGVKPLVTQILKDQFIQKWRAKLLEMPSCDFYVQFKDKFELEPYFMNTSLDINYEICRFRCGNTRIPKILGRYNRLPRESRLCTKCSLGSVGDEYHYLLQCTNENISRLRELYIGNICSTLQ